MSLASDYAAAVASANVGVVTAVATRPAGFTGPNGSASVTDTGDLLLTPTTGASNVVIPAAGALSFASWINTTFS